MKSILFLSLLFISGLAEGKTFYVSNSGKDGNSGISQAEAWQTLRKVQQAGNSGLIGPGDKILFKKGDSFTGTLTWSTIFGGTAPSGTATAPITFGSYGIGNKPIFQYPADSKTEVTKRILFSFIGVNYIIVDGFNVTDLNFPTDDKQTPANCGIAFNLGSYGDITNNYCVIKNTEMSNIGMGIVIVGDYNIVDSCKMTDLKNLKNTYSKTAPGNDDDYGANGITLSGNDNLITHNFFSGNWAESYDYGLNGGAIEAFGSTSRNKIMYNTIIDCSGVMEIGSSRGGEAADNLISNNLLINNGMLTYVNISGTFAIEASNIQYFNNTVIDLSNRAADKSLFAFNGSPVSNTVFNIQNNIFYLKSGINVARAGNDLNKYVHENNLYCLFAGADANFPLNKSEIKTTAPVFKNTTTADPLLWDYNLINEKHKDKGYNSKITNPFKDTILVQNLNRKIMQIQENRLNTFSIFFAGRIIPYFAMIISMLLVLMADFKLCLLLFN